jgi:protein O-mannosyl-transferase
MASRNVTSRGVGGKDLALALLLLGLLLVAYVPALNGGILWDDEAQVTKPSLQSLDGLWRISTQLGATQQYYPLLYSAFWFEHALWGDSVTGYHLINVLLHLTSALLLVVLLRRLGIPGAWLAAYLFALHPVQVETVAWISEQKNTLSTVFFFLSALKYLEFDETRDRKRYWIAFAWFVAALATKSVTAMLPAGLLVVLWWRRGKLDVRRDFAPLAPWLVVGAASGLFTAWVERTYVGAQGSAFTLGFWGKCLLAGRVFWFYLAKLFWPANLMFVYPHWTIDSGVWWQYLFPLGAVIAIGACALLAWKNRTPLAALLFFGVMLVPVLGFLNVYPFKFSWVADHFQYLASLGILVPCAAGLTAAAAKVPEGARKTGLAALFGVLLFLTWSQSGMYRDAYTLYSETVARNPDAWMAHNELGLMLGRFAERSTEAIQHLQAATRLQPESAEIHNNLGVVLSETSGRTEDAVTEFQAALKINPNYAEAHNNLGSALSELPGRKAEAIAEYQAALAANPGYAEAHNNLGSALSEQEGRLPEAIQQFEEALRLNPGLAEAHANLGVALAKTEGRAPEAVQHLEAALQLRPDMQQVRELLTRMKSGRQQQ